MQEESIKVELDSNNAKYFKPGFPYRGQVTVMIANTFTTTTTTTTTTVYTAPCINSSIHFIIIIAARCT